MKMVWSWRYNVIQAEYLDDILKDPIDFTKSTGMSRLRYGVQLRRMMTIIPWKVEEDSVLRLDLIAPFTSTLLNQNSKARSQGSVSDSFVTHHVTLPF